MCFVWNKWVDSIFEDVFASQWDDIVMAYSFMSLLFKLIPFIKFVLWHFSLRTKRVNIFIWVFSIQWIYFKRTKRATSLSLSLLFCQQCMPRIIIIYDSSLHWFASFAIRWFHRSCCTALSSWSFYEQFYSMQIWLMFLQFIVRLARTVCTRSTFISTRISAKIFNEFISETRTHSNMCRLAVSWFHKMQHTRTANTQWMIDAQQVVDNLSTVSFKKTKKNERRRLLLLPAMFGCCCTLNRQTVITFD